jgi:cobalamin synthase
MTFLVNLKMTNVSHEKTVKILRDPRLGYDPVINFMMLLYCSSKQYQ